MSQGRGHFVCGAIFGIALGFAVGHLIVRARTSADAQSVAGGLVPTPTDLDSGGGRLSTPRARLAQRDPDGPGGSVFDRYPAGGAEPAVTARQIITADAFRKDDPAAGATPGPAQQEPSPLPSVEALPIPPDSRPDEAIGSKAGEEELQGLLKEQLGSASPEENEAWKNALDGVPSGDAAEILKMWKSVGARPALGAGTAAPSPLGSFPPSPYYASGTGPAFTPLPPSPWPTDPHLSHPDDAVTGRLRMSHPKVWRQLQRDLAHAETPGYRRSIPELVDIGDSPADPKFRVTGLRTDFATAEPVQTGRMLDVSLTGNGFLSITTGQGRALTRLGRLGLDAERRLGVRLEGSVAPLDPEIRIPADVEGLEIDAGGGVYRVTDGVAAESPLGQITLVTVLDLGHLVAAEGQPGFVFVATPESGLPYKVAVGGCRLLQFALEGSNVVPEETRRWIVRLEALAAKGALSGE
jgi:flagellar basal body rod protein FlgG